MSSLNNELVDLQEENQTGSLVVHLLQKAYCYYYSQYCILNYNIIILIFISETISRYYYFSSSNCNYCSLLDHSKQRVVLSCIMLICDQTNPIQTESYNISTQQRDFYTFATIKRDGVFLFYQLTFSPRFFSSPMTFK